MMTFYRSRCVDMKRPHTHRTSMGSLNTGHVRRRRWTTARQGPERPLRPRSGHCPWRRRGGCGQCAGVRDSAGTRLSAASALRSTSQPTGVRGHPPPLRGVQQWAEHNDMVRFGWPPSPKPRDRTPALPGWSVQQVLSRCWHLDRAGWQLIQAALDAKPSEQ